LLGTAIAQSLQLNNVFRERFLRNLKSREVHQLSERLIAKVSATAGKVTWSKFVALLHLDTGDVYAADEAPPMRPALSLLI
jgi:hypothetical protein